MPGRQDDKQKMLPNKTGRRLSRADNEFKGLIYKANHNPYNKEGFPTVPCPPKSGLSVPFPDLTFVKYRFAPEPPPISFQYILRKALLLSYIVLQAYPDHKFASAHILLPCPSSARE
jgi:hypothetical protein